MIEAGRRGTRSDAGSSCHSHAGRSMDGNGLCTAPGIMNFRTSPGPDETWSSFVQPRASALAVRPNETHVLCNP